MARIKYVFHKESLQFKRLRYKGVLLSARFTGYFLLSLIPGIAMYLLVSVIHQTPGEIRLKTENRQLREQYGRLSDHIEELAGQLADIEQKDDELYRSLLGVKVLDSTIRLAGTGGVTGNLKEFPGLVRETTHKLKKVQSRMAVERYSLIKLMETAGKNKDRMLHLPAIMPVSNKDLSRTGSGFGMRFHPILKIRRMHEGIDFIAPAGTEVYATAEGIVHSVRYSSTFGNIIEIDHGYDYLTLYAHLQKFNVRKDQKVKRGELIGWMGSTGLAAGTHLHYEVHLKGKEVDPIHYFFNDLTAEQYQQIIERARIQDTSLD